MRDWNRTSMTTPSPHPDRWWRLGVAVWVVVIAAVTARVLLAPPRRRGLLLLFTVPGALLSLNNGQLNLPVIGLLLVMVAAAARERWTLAAVVAAGAVLLKIYPVAVALLLAVQHPRKFGPRFAL